MKIRIIFYFFSFLFLPALSLAQTTQQLTREQETWISKANRHEKNGWLYLHIEGNPEERGFQYGYLLANEIKESIRVISVTWEYQTAMKWSWLVQKAGGIFSKKVDPENLREINGMVKGMKAANISTSQDELVALNGYLELMWYWFPTIKDSLKINSPEIVKLLDTVSKKIFGESSVASIISESIFD